MRSRWLSGGIVLLLSVFLFYGNGFAAGTVTQAAAIIDTHARTVTFTCVGDAAAGTIPNTALTAENAAFVKGFYLYLVTVDPGAVPPDAADVFVLDAAGMDLLGSVDGGTTAWNGLNLIHATLTKAVFPSFYNTSTGAHVDYFPLITGGLTLQVSNQATVSATWTVTLTFAK